MIYPNIRIEMERGGFTVHQLAAILGLPLNTLIYKLYGKCEFTLYEMECLADLFGCSLDYLVGHRREGVKQLRYGDDYNGAFYKTKRKGDTLNPL